MKHMFSALQRLCVTRGQAGLSGIKSKGDGYIRESTTNPAAIIVEGFQDVMPKSFTNLKNTDLDDLVSYLNSFD
jgi:hypothetical protein